MSVVTDDRWTCPSCLTTVVVKSELARRAAQRRPCGRHAPQVSRTGHRP